MLGRGNKKDGERSADEQRWGVSKAELEKRQLVSAPTWNALVLLVRFNVTRAMGSRFDQTKAVQRKVARAL